MPLDERRSGRFELLAVGLSLPLAFALGYAVFALEEGVFWVKLPLSGVVLASISLGVMGPARLPLLTVQRRHLWLGLASALLLYGIFWVGKWVLMGLFPSTSDQIAYVYQRGQGASPWLIGPLLLLISSPAEEIYWRGLLQRVLVRRVGPMSGLLLATAGYALAYIWTLSAMLVLAAFVAGLVWGWIYLMERSLVPAIVSHSLWSLLVFVLLPLG